MLQSDNETDLLHIVEDPRNGRPPSSAARRVQVHLRPACTAVKEHCLSPRELEVLRALVEGLSYKMIAAELRINFEGTSKNLEPMAQAIIVRVSQGATKGGYP